MQMNLLDPQKPQFANLDELVAKMMTLEDDPLFPMGTKMVIYRGNPKARLMVIGEAPGAEEDRIGKPFVGPSGKLLDQILGAVNMDTEKDVFITNAVFRLPPGDGGKKVRKPTPDEIIYYKPYLLEIIRLIDPVIMLLSGAVAVQALFPEETLGITKTRGQWRQWNGRWAMPIFHPAYLLRNPSREPGSPKALTWQDVREMRKKYDELLG